ncbi:MAG: hypothetical protein O7G85_02535 [Planctomycetota bacterium]|nr:hypothetical protein [Planctomycetota bacterium]
MAELRSHQHHYLSQGAIPSSPIVRSRHIITLVKGEQRWRFHLERGHEREMIDHVAQLAEDPAHPLDWFDAAVVSHQITKQLESSLADPEQPGQDGNLNSNDAS